MKNVYIDKELLKKHMKQVLKLMRKHDKCILIYDDERLMAGMMPIERAAQFSEEKIKRPEMRRMVDDWFFVKKYLES